MRLRWYRRILIIILVFTVSVGGSYYLILDNKEEMNKEVTAAASKEMVIPGGMPIGIYMETDGVLVLGTDKIEGMDRMKYEPAAHLVKKGDYIIQLNEEIIDNKNTLVKKVSRLKQEEVVLKVRRGERIIDIKFDAVEFKKDNYKLGIWVKDNAQGLGTITYLKADSTFGALGHGIHDTDTSGLLEIDRGILYSTNIKEIQKGKHGLPGGMEGIIIYNNYNVLGSITANTENGIYGKVERVDVLFDDVEPVQIASAKEIKKGKAVIRCAIDGKVEEYEIEIEDINPKAKEKNKTLKIVVTDKELLKMTGGIVQGMSGSPIIQDGKLVGAVTHVLVNDPTRGYGIFIENMLEH